MTQLYRLGISIGERALVLDDRLTVVAKATPEQWVKAPLMIAYLAELRLARQLASPVDEMDNFEQQEWGADLAGRLRFASDDAPVVCPSLSSQRMGCPPGAVSGKLDI